MVCKNPFFREKSARRAPRKAIHEEERSMRKGISLTVIGGTILLAVFLQILFVYADQKATPGRVAREFSKAYYALDPAMETMLCQELQAESTLVQDFLHRKSVEARERGFNPSFLRSQLYHVETQILSMDQETAQVLLTAERKTAINPVFAYVGKLFSLGETHEVEHVLTLMREEDRWKVCSDFFRSQQG
jgi:hypothetical protein